MGSTSIAKHTVTQELFDFQQNPQSEAQCGLSPMLTWNWVSDIKMTDYSGWASSTPTSTNTTSVNIALCAIANYFPSQLSLESIATTSDLTSIIINTVSLFSFMMLYNQLSVNRKINSLDTYDPLVRICVGAVSASLDASIIPARSSVTNAYDLDSSLSAAKNAVVTYLNSLLSSTDSLSQDPIIPFLKILIPRFFTPVWTLSHFASYADGRMSSSSFYDQRYAHIAIVDAFSNWLTFIKSQATSTNLTLPNCNDINAWIDMRRKNIAQHVEGEEDIVGFYTSVADQVNIATRNIKALKQTNQQFERRRGRVATLSENLQNTQTRANIALAILVFWIVSLVISSSVAIYLFYHENYALLNILIIFSISLVMLDTLGRGVMGAMSSK